MKRISSKSYRDASRGQRCTLRISPHCDGGGETTVFAHIWDRHSGKSIKASDISGADACFPCHAMFDSGFVSEWHYYALRGLQETLENRIERGILVLPADAIETRQTKPTTRKVKPRKPKEQRAKVRPSRPLQSRNDLRRHTERT